MRAGTARIDITPGEFVWMDGMIRSHKSTGIRHRLYAKALALSSGDRPEDIFIIASADVCAIARADHETICAGIASQTRIIPEHIILAATHNHSGPAIVGYFNPKEEQYTKQFVARVMEVAVQAVRNMQPARLGCGSGAENTISHYRRLLAKDGRVVMNWEPHATADIIRPLGEIDPEVGVLKVVSADADRKSIALLFNHAGHPNVMSGDNYILSCEYPGLTESILETSLGGTAIFVNGAQGTMDIDGRKDRDWTGMERVAGALAKAVMQIAAEIKVKTDVTINSDCIHYCLPTRKISREELVWAESICAHTDGKVVPLSDGVGDDYKAALFKQLHAVEHLPHQITQVGIALGDAVWLSFPGELFTEIGQRIKQASPFVHTYIVGLANGNIDYVPTREAVRQGGYEPETRKVDESAGEIVFQQSTSLLNRLHPGNG